MRTSLSMLVAALVFAGCSRSVGSVPVTGTPGPNLRYIIGGDSRDDTSHVLPWAFREAAARGATAFFFLGDMELTAQLDDHVRHELPLLGSVAFYPVLGNHEVRLFGEVPVAHEHAERKFRARLLDTPATPVRSSLEGQVVYSATLAGGVHLVALDNVSQKGFGAPQLQWLAHDLEDARATPEVRFIIVGMHKPLAHNGVTTHSMDDDGPAAIADSDAALALMVKFRVSMIVASHLHGYVAFQQQGIPTYITGGLGAPLTHASPPIEAFHHFLQVDVVGDALKVDVVRFHGAPSIETEEEKE
jgi:hypothetical protein